MALPLLRPNWNAPPNVGAAMSLRPGGVSQSPWTGLNLALGVGDDPAAVAENRRRFAQALGVEPVWLRLVHSAQVLRLHAGAVDAPLPSADAAWTSERGVACTVSAADCLPVFFATRDGSAVAAAHAGWRGLAAGVLEATVGAICEGQGTEPAAIQAWLGPCIGPRRFEVGSDVLQAFGAAPAGDLDAAVGAMGGARFVFSPRADGAPRWRADLAGLARDRLLALGLIDIAQADACTFEDGASFFSFRRDGVTGRMAAAIWRD